MTLTALEALAACPYCARNAGLKCCRGEEIAREIRSHGLPHEAVAVLLANLRTYLRIHHRNADTRTLSDFDRGMEAAAAVALNAGLLALDSVPLLQVALGEAIARGKAVANG